MAEIEKPAWLEGWQPAPPKPKKPKRDGPGNPNWRAGGPSPNPSGRPVGIADRRLLATEQMLDELRAIIEVQVAKALDGDSGAAALVLARVLPALKPQVEKAAFPLDPSAPIPAQIEAVLAAIAAGTLAPDVGQTIISALGTLADARAAAELESRIAALEAKQL